MLQEVEDIIYEFVRGEGWISTAKRKPAPVKLEWFSVNTTPATNYYTMRWVGR